MRYVSALSDPNIQIGVFSDPGRTGKNNEDDYALFEARTVDDAGLPGAQSVLVAVVADGIGGNVGGEMASHLAAQTVHDFMRQHDRLPIRQRLVEAIREANNVIYERSLADASLTSMGTTIVIAAVVGHTLFVAHCGDSRAYLIRAGRAHLLTIDHTWAQEAIEAGRLTPAQARDHPNRHVIKRFLGISEAVEVDTGVIDIQHGPLDPDQLHLYPKTDRLQLEAGDAILLCTDGLNDVVTDKEIEGVVTRYAPLEAARRLVDLANKGGGPDNITVAILWYGAQRVPPPAGRRSSLVALALGVALVLLVATAWVILGLGGGSGEETDASATQSIAAVVAAIEAQSPTDTPVPTATHTPTSDETPTVEPTVPGVAVFDTPTPATPDEQEDAPHPPDHVATIEAAAATSAEVEDDTVSAMLHDAADTTGNTSDAITGSLDIHTPTATRDAARPAPTSTPVPDSTDTPTPSATPTVTPTPTMTNTPTPGPTRTPTQTPTLGSPTPTRVLASNTLPVTTTPSTTAPGGTVRLLAPSAGDTLSTSLEFRWTEGVQLPEGYAFEPVFWRSGQDPLRDGRGFGGSTQNTSLRISLETVISAGGQQGEYLWGVRLIRTEPNFQAVALISEPQRINISIPSGGGGSSSGEGSREGLQDP